MGDEGLERGPENEANSATPDPRGAECGAVGAESPPIDPDLAVVAECWAQLPEAIRAGIVAMVKSASKAE